MALGELSTHMLHERGAKKRGSEPRRQVIPSGPKFKRLDRQGNGNSAYRKENVDLLQKGVASNIKPSLVGSKKRPAPGGMEHQPSKKVLCYKPSDQEMKGSLTLVRCGLRSSEKNMHEGTNMQDKIKAARNIMRKRVGERDRERDREAARLALEKMERTVQFDDNFQVLRDFEMLIGCTVNQSSS